MFDTPQLPQASGPHNTAAWRAVRLCGARLRVFRQSPLVYTRSQCDARSKYHRCGRSFAALQSCRVIEPAGRLQKFQSVFRWLPTAWLAFIIIRYDRVAYRTVREPFNPGSDTTWAVAWIAVVLAVYISTALWKDPRLKRVWLGAVGLLALTMIVLGQAILPVLAICLILSVAAGLGELTLQRLHVGATPLLERLILTVPIGVGILALLDLILAWQGVFTSAANWILILVCAVPAFWGIRKLAGCEIEANLGKHSAQVIAIGLIFLLNLSWAIVPEIQYDAGNVYLAVPKMYLQQGGLIDIPYIWNSYMAHLLSLFYGLCMAIGGIVAPKVLMLTFGVLAMGAVYVFGSRFFNSEVGAWAALLFYSVPVVVASSATTSLDLAQTLFIASSALAFFRWYETRRWGWMAASGWIAGVATASKIVALSSLIAFPALTLFFGFKHWAQRKPASAIFRAVISYGLLLLIVSVPWYVVTYAYTGNPFFPFLNKIFQSPQYPSVNTTLDWSNFGIGTAGDHLFRLPFYFTWDTSRFASARGGAGFVLLLAIPLAAVYFWKGTFPQRALVAAAGIHFIVWAFTAQYARYIIPALPFLAAAGCGVFLTNLSGVPLKINRALLLAGLLAQMPVASVLFWNIPDRYPIAHAFGRESQESFLERSVPAYRAAKFLNGTRRPEEKSLGTGVESARFYFDGPIHTDYVVDLATFKGDALAELHAAIVRDGFSTIVTLNSMLEQPPGGYPFLRQDFLDRYATRTYSDSAVSVFRILN